MSASPPEVPCLIEPALPALRAARRLALPRPPGSADALLLAELARSRAPGGPWLVVTAEPADAQRLLEEIRWFAPSLRCGVLPDWETLPYDAFSPHQDLVSERLATLWALHQRELDMVLVAASTALQRLAPAAFLAATTFRFDKGQQLDEASLRSQLVLAGYAHVTQVVAPGEYAVRGGLLDLHPMGSTLPLRVDLFGDTIDSIHTFDPDSQRSLYPVDTVRLLPGREFPLDEPARQRFRAQWRERIEGDPSRSPLYRDIAGGVAGPGIEYYLPLFFEHTATLLDYCGAQAGVVLLGDVAGAMRRFWSDTSERWRLLRADPERPALAPAELYLREEDFFVGIQPLQQLALRGGGARTEGDEGPPAAQPGAEEAPAMAARLGAALPELAIERRAEQPLRRLQEWLDAGARARPPMRVLLCADSPGRRESLLEMLREARLEPRGVDDWAQALQGEAGFALAVAPLAAGFQLPERQLAVLTETELLALGAAQRRQRKQERASDVENLIRDLSELKPGDPVVHQQHGIGRYQGLVSMDLGDGPTELLHILYAKEASLYVPVAQLHLIARYSGVDPEHAPLHTLGSGQWDKARRKAAEQIRDTAAELLNLYARRASRPGHAFRFPAQDYEAFAAGFGFDETADQAAAIHAVVQDMVSGKPMDRLVCGDVGFGKTEVALRAAFVAVMGGRQVAVLAPTTLLAEQHVETFRNRFADWPVRIAELSRFRSPKEVRTALQGLTDGTVDIVIGTHKLLSADVRFERLGLVIVDEEHRFGVRHKEALKALRAEVDMLTLTATPIPRTMGMAMEGLRDLSVIATAPQKRLAIKTFVRNESKAVIREAVLREIKRGGQVYFLHNEVDTIARRREMLQELIPEARIEIAHGQMHERELERVMRDFHAQRFNLLLCSTIIETGIDVPTANTIVISRSDKFGLAQLHQLRGRVGRSHHQAYAYLLVPEVQSLSKTAQLRLEAITQMEELGAGFYLAMHDLEIRGAGEALGEAQSGNVQEVGYQMYLDMLGAAVKALKAGQEPDLMQPLAATTEINLHEPALLPQDYCPDVNARLNLYKRMASAASEQALQEVAEEIVDRFGRMPKAALNLIETHRLRLLAQAWGVLRVDAAEQHTLLQFRPDPPVDAARIIWLVQNHRHVRLAGNDRLRIERQAADAAARARLVRDTLRLLGEPRSTAPASAH
ncbi:MAG: transcription-repair coupling factor [Betaproteobacteria bacterium]|nr:transcription-repair coupling factor [Betaproteobacteria bacterium]MBU6511269.1 transcription-repair coupling factor [Betaproteobacteria bacterium]MDE1954311.1 transcription-repair coupling factor [Betaproteobacteria bacterium]MDE2152832.1 transcription-repair coupling factor [Betaproteobacteria bacterium]